MTGSPVTVLVVDDEDRVRAALTELLKLLGFHVVGTARDGREAIEQVGTLEPDVVLMDMRMPEMDGLEAARAILPSSPATAVVILSAYDDPTLAGEAVASGVSAFLAKGCPGQEIRDAVGAAARSRPPVNQPTGPITSSGGRACA